RERHDGDVAHLDVILVRLERRVGLAGGLEVAGALERRPAPAVPDGLDAHAHVDVLGGHFLHEVEDPDVGAVEQDRGRHVGDLDLLAVERHVDDAEGRDGPLVGDRHLLVGGHAARRARAARRDVHLAAVGTALAEQLALLDVAQEARRGSPRREAVLESHRSADPGDGLGHPLSSGSKQAMSWISPPRSSRQRTLTRMPVAMRLSSPASTACSSPVSAPSSRTSAHANGCWSGCRSRGWCTHAQVVTTPACPTSTKRSSPSVSLVTGSYSVGGTITRPSPARMPRIRPSRRPVMNLPITGPTDRA